MNPSTIPPMSSTSPTPMGRRVCSKMANKSPNGHTRSPRSRYSLTYADWITRALMASKDKCACLSDIYEWMSFNVPGLQEQRFLHSSKGWKNAVRHTLSINPRFQKLKRLGKPALWTLSEDYLRQAHALTKISMSITPRRDSESIQMLGPNGNVEMSSTSMDTSVQTVPSPQSKICYVGKSTLSPDLSNHGNTNDMIDTKPETSFGARMATLTQEAYRTNALLQEQFRNSNFLPTTTTTSVPTQGLIQACDAAAVASRAAFFSDLSALASLNALITANNESMDVMDPMRQRFSAVAAAETAALVAQGLAGVQSNVAATPPLMNFFTSPSNCHYNAGSRRGSGDSGISTISNSSMASTTSSLGSNGLTSEPLRPFTQSLDVTTLSGLEATLVLPRPLPIQCLTDHKLLLASLIWPNPAAGFFTN